MKKYYISTKRINFLGNEYVLPKIKSEDFSYSGQYGDYMGESGIIFESQRHLHNTQKDAENYLKKHFNNNIKK